MIMYTKYNLLLQINCKSVNKQVNIHLKFLVLYLAKITLRTTWPSGQHTKVFFPNV